MAPLSGITVDFGTLVNVSSGCEGVCVCVWLMNLTPLYIGPSQQISERMRWSWLRFCSIWLS